MQPTGYFIDTNLLTLLVIGSLDPELIAKHRQLQGYSSQDFVILNDLLGSVKTVFVTPNTLTETSNLLAQHGEPERSRFFEKFRLIIHTSEELVVASKTGSDNSKFGDLGLTDAVLLEAITSEAPPVTVDLDLYLAALDKVGDTAVNFTHLRTHLR